MEHLAEEEGEDKQLQLQAPQVLLKDVPELLVHGDAPSQLRVVVGREHEGRRTFGSSVAMYSGDH